MQGLLATYNIFNLSIKERSRPKNFHLYLYLTIGLNFFLKKYKTIIYFIVTWFIINLFESNAYLKSTASSKTYYRILIHP